MGAMICKQLGYNSETTTESESEPEGQDSFENNNEPVLSSIPRRLITERDGSSGLRTSGRICRPSKRLSGTLTLFSYIAMERMVKHSETTLINLIFTVVIQIHEKND